MGFNTEVSRIRSGLKSGKYRNKPNLAKAFMDPFIKGIERQELERIQKDKEDRARAAAAAKAAASEQRAKEKADAKAQDMVNFIIMTNPEIQATEAINKQLFTLAKTGDFKDAGAFQTFIDDNATFNPPTTEMQPISKIEMAPPFRIDQGVGKLNSTTFQSTTGDFTGKRRSLTSLDVPRLAERNDVSGDVAQQMIDSGLNPQQVGEPLGEKEVNVEPTLTFGKKPEDISEFFSGIKDIDDWNSKGSEISAMPEGPSKERYITAWKTIGEEKRFEATVSDDPFKDADGNYRSQSEIEVISRDSNDPEIQARGRLLTTNALDPATMQREDLVAKIAIMEASNAKADKTSPVFTEEDMAPFRTALESKNSLKTKDAESSAKIGTAKEIAKLAYIEANGVLSMSPKDKIVAMQTFEQEWGTETAKVEKRSETYTTANYTSDLIKFSQMLASTDQAQVEQATKWFTTTKPLIEATMLNIANMSEEGRIKLLEDAGVPRDKATSIALGLIKTTNDGFGNPILVDISSGSGSPVNDAPQNTGEAGSDLESQASISDTGALIFRNEDGSTDELLSAEDLKIAQAELEEIGIQGRIDSLDDVTAAFGPSGWFGKITNTALGPVTSENPAKEAGAAMSAIKSLNVVTTLQMVTMFPNIRDSVTLKAQLKELLPEVGKFWYSDAKALEDFANAQGVLQTAIKTNDDIVNDRVGITNVSKSKAQAALLALEPLEKVYATIVQKMREKGIGGGPATSTNRPITDTVLKNPAQEKSTPEAEVGIVGALPTLTPELATAVLAAIKNGDYSAKAARNSFYKKFSKESVDRLIPLN